MENETSFLSTTLFFLLYTVIAQNVAINNDQLFPNPNALLYLKSGNKGIPIPRMDSAARKAIANTKGLLVYDTTYNTFWFNTGKSWQNQATVTGAGWITAVAGGAVIINGPGAGTYVITIPNIFG